ncbi:uncharacterized protein [Ptychodera flava]|uniref:uncharacterized protein isoform X1 n=2 Tax=Ptychodera flava TaxID=63121 RepID=UPI00396AA158
MFNEIIAAILIEMPRKKYWKKSRMCKEGDAGLLKNSTKSEDAALLNYRGKPEDAALLNNSTKSEDAALLNHCSKPEDAGLLQNSTKSEDATLLNNSDKPEDAALLNNSSYELPKQSETLNINSQTIREKLSNNTCNETQKECETLDNNTPVQCEKWSSNILPKNTTAKCDNGVCNQHEILADMHKKSVTSKILCALRLKITVEMLQVAKWKK